ncbi:poly(rC)-binding protein 3-like isoform X1 [Anneissia japonica]|uniref:poly(rC)-binding protein 3-like isoform X1 n=1 Tax=Anneissia japonica TaxID=1529436 RepID=UPI0014256951|nr:poly(rC)-binding protein 3-like isoform X1 [Anneissia japonica]XP_033098122.1 poly(rC)-binding protein 3-like isoform X1 [Anneissia japonica]
MTSEDKMTGESPAVTLTIRLVMLGKEVGSIIGKKGDTVKKFREESGARINISDGTTYPERIVTITGSTDSIIKAFKMITNKFEEDLSSTMQSPTAPKPPVTLKLVVPASQCGSLIGKQGCKIKEIRETTGASIQVATDMLPNSTERAVTISGTPDAITQAVYHICCVMLECPPKGATIPYRPKATGPIVFSGGQAYAVHGNYAIPQPDLSKVQQLALQPSPVPFALSGQSPYPQGVMSHIGGLTQPNNNPATQTTHEIHIPNNLIGCVIGRKGAKINEIRHISGANIKIADSVEGNPDRSVTITGTPEAIHLAHYLINTSLDSAKAASISETSPSSTTSTTQITSSPPTANSPTPLVIPLSELMKPVPLLGLDTGALKHTFKDRSAFSQLGRLKFMPY